MERNEKMERVTKTKTCNVCGVRKNLVKGFRPFPVVGGYHYSNTCIQCYVDKTKARHSLPGVKEEHNLRQRESNQRIKQEVMNHYGGKCSCCGERNMGFLTIDHIHGGGRKERESVKKSMSSGGSYYYRWLRDSGYPGDLRVLCYNCNCGREANGGICPHQLERR